jgi:hypothetical protein
MGLSFLSAVLESGGKVSLPPYEKERSITHKQQTLRKQPFKKGQSPFLGKMSLCT